MASSRSAIHFIKIQLSFIGGYRITTKRAVLYLIHTNFCKLAKILQLKLLLICGIESEYMLHEKFKNASSA